MSLSLAATLLRKSFWRGRGTAPIESQRDRMRRILRLPRLLPNPWSEVTQSAGNFLGVSSEDKREHR